MPDFMRFMDIISGLGRQKVADRLVQTLINPLKYPAFEGAALPGLKQLIHYLARSDLADNELEHRRVVFGLGIGKGGDPLFKVAINVAAGQNFGLRRPQIEGVQPLKLEAGKASFFKFAEFRVVNDRETHKAIIP